MKTFDSGLLAARAMLKRFALSLYKNEDDANDAVQETFCKAIANRDKFEAGTNLNAWLITILRNHFRSSIKKGWRKSSANSAEGPRLFFTDNTQYADHIVAPGNPEKDLINKETLHEVLRLPDNWFDAVVRSGLGFRMKETAHILGVPEGTVKSRVNRARIHLAEATT